jgi:hypothetical protein
MLQRIVFGLCAVALVLAGAGQARAGLVYDNGYAPIIALIDFDQVEISGGSVSDSFTVAATTNLALAQVELRILMGDLPASADWSIGTTAFGSDVGSGTGTFTNTFASTDAVFNVYESTFAISGSVSPGTTYWLTLQNATSQLGDNVAWLESFGPSSAELVGGSSIPSESFQLYDNTVVSPEPASLALAVLGVPGMTVLCRRLRRR